MRERLDAWNLSGSPVSHRRRLEEVRLVGWLVQCRAALGCGRVSTEVAALEAIHGRRGHEVLRDVLALVQPLLVVHLELVNGSLRVHCCTPATCDARSFRQSLRFIGLPRILEGASLFVTAGAIWKFAIDTALVLAAASPYPIAATSIATGIS